MGLLEALSEKFPGKKINVLPHTEKDGLISCRILVEGVGFVPRCSTGSGAEEEAKIIEILSSVQDAKTKMSATKDDVLDAAKPDVSLLEEQGKI